MRLVRLLLYRLAALGLYLLAVVLYAIQADI